MTQTSNIDDVLATAHLPPEKRVPPTPESKVSEPDTSLVDDLAGGDHTFEVESKPNQEKTGQNPDKEHKKEEKATQQSKPDQETAEDDGFDEYGNEKPKKSSKTYSEEEVNERINQAVRERFARMEKNNPNARPQTTPQGVPQQPNTQQPQNPEDWQAQLKDFIWQAQEEKQREEMTRVQQQKEQQAIVEFESKFHEGMGKFQDFRDVVGTQPFSDAMVMATRAMKDPASFMYAAAKRHATEIQRIAQIPDAYAQMVEIGRLEERMKKTQSSTKAPRPVRPTREDATLSDPEPRPKSFDDILANNDSHRLARINSSVYGRGVQRGRR